MATAISSQDITAPAPVPVDGRETLNAERFAHIVSELVRCLAETKSAADSISDRDCADDTLRQQRETFKLMQLNICHTLSDVGIVLSPGAAQAYQRARRMRGLTAHNREVIWTFPGTDCCLLLEVEQDGHGNRYVNDVRDTNGNQFPWESVQHEGVSLVEVLEKYVREMED